MNAFATSSSLSFLTVLLLTPLLIRICTRYRLALALPDSRKVHRKPIPQAGGIAFLFAFLLVDIFSAKVLQQPREELRQLHLLLATVGLVSLAGLADDLFELRPAIRLAIQCGAALWLVRSGIEITTISHPISGTLALRWLSLPVTLIWIVGVTNALNFIDGLDGLASGLTLLASLAFFLLAHQLHEQSVNLFILCGVLAGSSLAFLRYNSFPAAIFMGDGGAYFFGFLLSVAAILGPFKSLFFFVLLTPFLAMGLPLLDMTTSVFRRLLHRKSPAAADRGHLHHQLLERGFTPKQAVLFMYFVAAIFILTALFFSQPL